jgi:hypothetical protein
MAKCQVLLKVCQQSTERQDYAFNWTHEFARRWQPYFPFAAAIAIRPSTVEGATGFEYISSGGVSGAEEPVWSETSGETVVDGSIIWTAAPMSNASLKHRVNGASVWTAEAGLTLEDEVTTDTPGLQESRIWVEGGVTGQTYRNFVAVPTDQGAIYEGELRIKIE